MHLLHDLTAFADIADWLLSTQADWHPEPALASLRFIDMQWGWSIPAWQAAPQGHPPARTTDRWPNAYPGWTGTLHVTHTGLSGSLRQSLGSLRIHATQGYGHGPFWAASTTLFAADWSALAVMARLTGDAI